FDDEAGVMRFPYALERGVRYPDQPTPIGPASVAFREAKKTLLVNRDVEDWFAAQGAGQSVVQGEPSKSVLFVPLIVGNEVRGRISLQNVDHEDAFTESDARLLTTIASSLS